MVKPPSPGTRRFIDVQIDPAAQRRWIENAPEVDVHRSADPAKTPVTTPDPPQTAGSTDAMPPVGANPKMAVARPGPRRDAAYDWFWKVISPALTDGAGRFQAALAALTMGPGGTEVRGPRLQRLQQMARTWGATILKATVGTRVSPALVLAVMAAESGGRADALSAKGAQGLMQLIPATAGRFGVDASDPAQNIQGAVAYLDWLMGDFHGDPLMVLAAYNAGENAVKNAGGVPNYAETRDYVPKVLAAWKVARGLCVTPPQFVSDGCVFKVLSAAPAPAPTETLAAK
ncbi:lytic transglycosylase domain-containing protein [Acidimangrovimonas sediminis]|uniref:lytic transglycosylase domain-containing protein n=1 Tax=Acidimangrovimonas sediminis TaxID=2056283 RepID=UPI001E62D2AD|nr:lytic transglycosylase domain-containing protein [Acidimangrovimonas sediminis]